MSGAEQRISPLEKDDAAAWNVLRRIVNERHPTAIVRDKRLRDFPSRRRFAHLEDVRFDLGNVLRREPEDVRLARQLLERAGELRSRRGTDLTEILCENDIRRQISQQDLIDLIQTLAAA